MILPERRSRLSICRETYRQAYFGSDQNIGLRLTTPGKLPWAAPCAFPLSLNCNFLLLSFAINVSTHKNLNTSGSIWICRLCRSLASNFVEHRIKSQSRAPEQDARCQRLCREATQGVYFKSLSVIANHSKGLVIVFLYIMLRHGEVSKFWLEDPRCDEGTAWHITFVTVNWPVRQALEPRIATSALIDMYTYFARVYSGADETRLQIHCDYCGQ